MVHRVIVQKIINQNLLITQVDISNFVNKGVIVSKKNAAVKSKEVAANRTEDENIALYSKVTETCLRKYGKKRASATQDVIHKTKQTCLEKYGHVSYVGSDVYRNHCQQAYGVSHRMQTSECKDAKIQTNLLKYGVKHCFQSPKIRKK
jgi:hypothetical protein